MKQRLPAKRTTGWTSNLLAAAGDVLVPLLFAFGVGSIPVAVGSGVTEKNIAEKMQIADILIIGTTLRRNGSMAEPIDEAQARALLRAAGREV